MIRLAPLLAFLLVGLVGLLGCGPSTPPAPSSEAPTSAKASSTSTSSATTSGAPIVAAAADLRYVLPELLEAFQQEQPAIRPQVVYGASGSLFAQIENGAPFDLFLSADIELPRRLAERGLSAPDSAFPYAVGHLVLWTPNASPIDVERLGMRALRDDRVRRIALANPKVAPYARAAEAALRHYGLEDAVRNKLVIGENVSQAAQFVENGGAEVGLIALSIVKGPALSGKGRYWPVPPEAHPMLLQGGVVVGASDARPAAELLQAFLTGEPARRTFARYGFDPPP